MFFKGIAWSFRFPSANALQKLGTSIRKKRDGASTTGSCKDLRHHRRNTMIFQSTENVEDEPIYIITSPKHYDYLSNYKE